MQWMKFKSNWIHSEGCGITLYQVSINGFKKIVKICFVTLIMAAREKVGMKGRFHTFGLELKHKLQKKQMANENVLKNVAAVTAKLQ